MKVEHNTGVSVEFCTQHQHPLEIGHLRLPQDVRDVVASKLNEGVSVEKILDPVGDNVSANVGRTELLNRQDIQNIARQFNI